MSALLTYLMNAVAVVSGLSGVIMGWKGYWATRDFKKLDLRIAFRKDCESLKHAIAAAERLMQDANASQRNLEGSPYAWSPEEREAWAKRFSSDAGQLDMILQNCLQRIESATRLTGRDLEASIVECHSYSLRVADLARHYEQSIDSDLARIQAVKLRYEEMTRPLFR